MRALLAQRCGQALADSIAQAGGQPVDDVCADVIRAHVESGQPQTLPCPHRDAGVLAVRASFSSSTAATGCGLDAPSAGLTEEDRLQGNASCGCAKRNKLNVQGENQTRPVLAAGIQQSSAEQDLCRDQAPKLIVHTADQVQREAADGHEQQGGPLASGDRTAGPSLQLELGVVHNSSSMAVGFFGRDMVEPQCMLLRQGKLLNYDESDQGESGMCHFGTALSWKHQIPM